MTHYQEVFLFLIGAFAGFAIGWAVAWNIRSSFFENKK